MFLVFKMLILLCETFNRFSFLGTTRNLLLPNRLHLMQKIFPLQSNDQLHSSRAFISRINVEFNFSSLPLVLFIASTRFNFYLCSAAHEVGHKTIYVIDIPSRSWTLATLFYIFCIIEYNSSHVEAICSLSP